MSNNRVRLPFLRKSRSDGEPLIVAMTGVRLGESVIFRGRSPGWVVPLAARTGLSGRCLVLGPTDVTTAIESAATREGVLIETASTPPRERSFDLAVVEVDANWEAGARDVKLATRPGGRIVVVAGAPPRSGLFAKLGGGGRPSVTTASIVSTLTGIGWERVRPIGERDEVSFVEGFAP